MSLDLETFKEVVKLHGMKCVLTGVEHVNFHHNLIFGGRAVQNAYFIIPISKRIHDIIHGHGTYTSDQRKKYQDKVDLYMLSNTPKDLLDKYSKVYDLRSKLARLTEKYERTNSA